MHDFAEAVERQEDQRRIGILVETLELFASRGCTRTSSMGLGACFRNGYVRDAKYGADQACEGCIARQALKEAGV
jgi:hypothetical protein